MTLFCTLDSDREPTLAEATVGQVGGRFHGYGHYVIGIYNVLVIFWQPLPPKGNGENGQG